MRDPKFRVWDKILQCYTKDSMGLLHSEGTITFDAGDRYIFEQYIGLKDKKRTKEFPDGQPIYEGDKIEADGTRIIGHDMPALTQRVNSRNQYIVAWDDIFLGWKFIGEKNLAWKDEINIDISKRNMEVIGTIHDKNKIRE